MNIESLTAWLQFLGSIIGMVTGILVSNKLTTYRIEQLEKKVDKHNSVVERTYRLEERQNALYERVEELEKDVKKDIKP